MKKKISFIITSLVRSGAEKVTFLLAKRCLELGYDVDIVMMLYSDIEFEVPDGINIIDLSGNTQSRIRRIPFWIRSLKKYFKNREPDIVVSFIARINIFTLLTVNKKKTKVVLSERNDPRYDRNMITKMLVRILYPKADTVVFQTKEAMQLFSKRAQKKGTVIENPITIDEFATSEFDTNLITFAGRYSKQKDIPTILKAAKIVSNDIPNIRFELYGTGPLKQELIDLSLSYGLKDVVCLNDNIPDINKKMRSSFLFVMSSLYEGMSNSLLEASYSGVPCLTTPVLGSSVIKNGENGYFFDYRNSEQLAKLIIELHQDKDKYRKLRERSICIAKSLKHDDVFEKWMNILK